MDLFGKWELKSLQAKEETEPGFLHFENVL